MTELIEEFEQAGVLATCSSPYNHSTFLVTKANARGKSLDELTAVNYRYISDMRKINALAVEPRSNLPLFNKILARISGNGPTSPLVISSMDFSSGYFQILTHPSSWSILSYKQIGKSICYCRMPQGLSSSPFMFSSLMDSILSELTSSEMISEMISKFISKIVLPCFPRQLIYDASYLIKEFIHNARNLHAMTSVKIVRVQNHSS